MELKQHIADERTGISYTLRGDYYLLHNYFAMGL